MDFVHKKSPKAARIAESAGLLAYNMLESTNEKAMAVFVTTHIAGLPVRLICSPPKEIKGRQKRIADELANIPNHPRSYGFVRGRSPFDCAQAHLSYWGRQDKGLTLLNIDLKNFFHSIREPVLVNALAGHGVDMTRIDQILDVCTLQTSTGLAAKAIAGLLKSIKIMGPKSLEIPIPSGDPRGRTVTIQKNRPIPGRTLSILERTLSDRFSNRLERYDEGNLVPIEKTSVIPYMLIEHLIGVKGDPGTRFLPQGSPASPVLSNLVMKLPDIRLTALAKSFGAFYTRYADDLTFSWPYFQKGKTVDGLKRCVIDVMSEYQLEPNPKKIRVMGPGQNQEIVGYNINSGRPTIPSEYRNKLRRRIHDVKIGRAEPTGCHDPMTLMGKAGYISIAHPQEFERLKSEINGLACLNRKRAILIPKTNEYEPLEEDDCPEISLRRFTTVQS